MATKKSNKLSPSIIKQAHDKTFTQRKVTVVIDNKNYEILLDSKFTVDKIKNYLMGLTQMYQQLFEVNQILDIPVYTTFLLLKEFTDLDLSGLDSFEEAVRVVKYLDDMDALAPIINSFDQKEANRINQYVKLAQENKEQLDKNPELQKEYADLMKFVAKIIDDKNKEDELLEDDEFVDEEVIEDSEGE